MSGRSLVRRVYLWRVLLVGRGGGCGRRRIRRVSGAQLALGRQPRRGAGGGGGRGRGRTGGAVLGAGSRPDAAERPAATWRAGWRPSGRAAQVPPPQSQRLQLPRPQALRLRFGGPMPAVATAGRRGECRAAPCAPPGCRGGRRGRRGRQGAASAAAGERPAATPVSESREYRREDLQPLAGSQRRASTGRPMRWP